jgi:hypothetical protein
MLLAVVDRISTFLAERRLLSFAISAAAIVLMADAIREVMPDEGEVKLFTWIALGLMAYAAIGTAVLPKRVAPNVRLMVAWAMAISPAMYGFAAALTDSPVVVMWFGVVLSLCLVAWIAIAKAPGPTKRETGDIR